jgi:glycosyltransferase involved in cell wall biosynthesis
MISKALVVGTYHKKLEELVRSGLELHLVVPRSWGNQKLEVRDGNGYIIYPMRIAFNGHNHFHFYFGLSGIIKKIKPDIVHIDEEHYSFVTFQTMRLAKKVGARALFFTWQNIYKDYPFPFSYFEKYNFKRAGVAIAGNEESKYVIRRKGFEKEIFIIPQFGVDPDMFQKKDVFELKGKLGIKTGSFVIGFIGRLVEEKGILVLLEAVSRLKDNFFLLLIGSGPLKKKILVKSKKSGITSRIKIVDHVPSMEVPNYINCFDCLVLPSLTKPNWKEQFGRVLIEAMACEIPVIGSDSGEIPNVIGDAGLISNEGDAADLAKKLKIVLTDRELRESLAKKGKERVLANYTQKKVAEATFLVYKNLMSTY